MKPRPARKTVEQLSDPQSVAERIAARTVVTATGCHEWMGTRNQRGYGLLKITYTSMVVSRLAWTLTNGAIPDGMFVCHKCDNPPCCNVDHLFLGTHRENMADMVSKGRSAAPNQQLVLDALAKLGSASSNELRLATGLSLSATKQSLRHLRAGGRLLEAPIRNGRVRIVFRLPAEQAAA